MWFVSCSYAPSLACNLLLSVVVVWSSQLSCHFTGSACHCHVTAKSDSISFWWRHRQHTMDIRIRNRNGKIEKCLMAVAIELLCKLDTNVGGWSARLHKLRHATTARPAIYCHGKKWGNLPTRTVTHHFSLLTHHRWIKSIFFVLHKLNILLDKTYISTHRCCIMKISQN